MIHWRRIEIYQPPEFIGSDEINLEDVSPREMLAAFLLMAAIYGVCAAIWAWA